MSRLFAALIVATMVGKVDLAAMSAVPPAHIQQISAQPVAFGWSGNRQAYGRIQQVRFGW